MRHGQDRHKPDGQWVQTWIAESVVGVQYRKADAVAFAKAARNAEARGWVYGVELEHRPDNPHDSNAIAIIGIAERRGYSNLASDDAGVFASL